MVIIACSDYISFLKLVLNQYFLEMFTLVTQETSSVSALTTEVRMTAGLALMRSTPRCVDIKQDY